MGGGPWVVMMQFHLGREAGTHSPMKENTGRKDKQKIPVACKVLKNMSRGKTTGKTSKYPNSNETN